MNVLITSASAELAQFLGAALSEGHQVRLTDRTIVQTPQEFALSGLGHDISTRLLVRGMDAIVHVRGTAWRRKQRVVYRLHDTLHV